MSRTRGLLQLRQYRRGDQGQAQKRIVQKRRRVLDAVELCLEAE